jgi:hypothetical protein
MQAASSPLAPSLFAGPSRAITESLKQARSFSRRYLQPKPQYVADVLVMWYGSFGTRGGPTVGDLYAVDNVAAQLRAAGIPNSVVTADFDIPDHVRVKSVFGIKRPSRGVVFVCGPLVDWSDLIDFLTICEGVPRVAVGVSVLQHHRRIHRALEAVVARDGAPGSTFDLSVSHVVEPAGQWLPFRRVGLCLRGNQTEYAQGSNDRRASELLHAVASHFELEVVPIDTLLTTDTPHDQFLRALEGVDVVFTTRMHGGILSLAHGKPVIAIDQILGGAKVKAVLDRVQWPFVFCAEDASREVLCRAVEQLQSAEGRAQVVAAQNRVLTESRAAMAVTLQTVTGLLA